MVLFFCFLLFAKSPAVTVHEKLSLLPFVEKLQNSAEVAQIFKHSKDRPPNKQDLSALGSNKIQLEKLKQEFMSQKSFVRGEIETEKNISALVSYLQVSLVLLRSHAYNRDWPAVAKEAKPWIDYAANLVYEESSVVGLRFAAVIRSLILDEFEALQARFKGDLASDRNVKSVITSFRAPWPIDRIVFLESKRFLKGSALEVAERLTQQLQKSPYKPISELLGATKNSLTAQDHDFLVKLWGPSDIEIMKEELNRLGKLQLKLAMEEYFNQKGVPAKSADELRAGGFLERLPTDYKTGKAMVLPL